MASPIVENLLSPRLLSHLWEIYLKNPNHTSPQYGNSPYWLFTQSRCLLTGYSSIMLTAGKKNARMITIINMKLFQKTYFLKKVV